MKERGSWSWWMHQLADASLKLPHEHHELPDSALPLYVRNLPRAEVAAAVQAVRLYAQRREWPELTPAVSDQIDVRIAHATQVCDLHRARRQASRCETWSEVFCWLLLDCWDTSAPIWADAMAQYARGKK